MQIFEAGLFVKKKNLPYIGASPDAIAPVIAVEHLLLNADVYTALKVKGFLMPGIEPSFYGWVVVEYVWTRDISTTPNYKGKLSYKIALRGILSSGHK